LRSIARRGRRFRRSGPASTKSSESARSLALIDVAPEDEFPPGSVKIVRAGSVAVGVYNLNGKYCAIEDRCSHDDGPLAEGEFELEEEVICPRHGSRFDICSGRPLTLPAYEPVETYPVVVEDDWVKVDVT
jgi:3-phenylpropionate/trans-cinnamate dioxygenase ferredoxin subunit